MPTAKRYKWRTFISHNKRQKPWVRQVVDQWRGLGLRVFFDEDSIDLGEDVTAGIERGLQGSRYIVLVISPEAVASRWVALEAAIGIYGDPDARERRIIPVDVVPTEKDTVQPAIRRLSRVDLTDPVRRRENYHRLLVALKVKKGIPLPDPPTPTADRSRWRCTRPRSDPAAVCGKVASKASRTSAHWCRT